MGGIRNGLMSEGGQEIFAHMIISEAVSRGQRRGGQRCENKRLERAEHFGG